ncbi:MAG: hypothetical protein NC079_08725 [Clostridium sp.]|nr:hypothetical protein [Acetatifactor muris]MCM1528300.1 hypothetical protein [Bacteroides sp.]MCM1563678.1 hypothetical protein [Clostridium sp.]
MEKRILNYRRYMDELLAREDADWEKVRAEHLVQVGFFQHERLIHLIVTVIFAVLTVMAICMSFLLMSIGAEGAIGWLAVVAVFLVLLIPYVRHYYILENEVQKMYAQYDRIAAKLGAGFQ